MKGQSRKPRQGAVKKTKNAQIGSGGQGRQALEGKKPTPKAEDRPYHPAGKKKAAQGRLVEAQSRSHARENFQSAKEPPQKRSKAFVTRPKHETAAVTEIVGGRNAVLEALRAGLPVSTLYIASRADMDDRMREILTIAKSRSIPMLEVMRQEIDRMTVEGSIHQGIAIKVPPYNYSHPEDLLVEAKKRKTKPLFVALDGITDPRNLGAIIRSVAAFGGDGVIVPARRSAGVTAAAWKTSAGACAVLPVALAGNLTNTIKAFKAAGVFVVGLDGGGTVDLPNLDFSKEPLLVVVGSEGNGLSRLVSEQCDAIVSIPISRATESLNAGIATAVTLYQIAMTRAS